MKNEYKLFCLADTLYEASRRLTNLTCWCHHPHKEPLAEAWLIAVKEDVAIAIGAAIEAGRAANNTSMEQSLEDAHRKAFELATLLVDRPALSTVMCDQWTLECRRQLVDNIERLASEIETAAKLISLGNRTYQVFGVEREAAADAGEKEPFAKIRAIQGNTETKSSEPNINALLHSVPKAESSKNKPTIEIVAGGFSYREKTHELSGRPRDMLAALVIACDYRLTAEDLRKALAIDDESVNHPEQVVKDTAKKLKKALKKAVHEAGLSCENPLRSIGKGKDLTYMLDMP